ncbi:MAG: efflux RND transporter periplasmic adaptor subunit [Phycisphaerales bacterium]
MRVFLGICVTLIVLLGAALVIAGPKVTSWMPSFSSTTKATSVRVHEVKIGPLVETVAAPGEISPFTKVNISAEVSARILELPFREGDRVTEGDLVVRLDAREYQAQLDSTKARRDSERFRLQAERSAIAGPQASLANARAVLERQRALLASGDVARQVVDDAEARVTDLESQVESARHSINVAEAQIAAAEADIDRTQKLVDKCIIKSPMSGMITVLNAEIGELVMVGTMNNAGTVIMTIGDLSRVKLDAQVNEADIAKVQRDQKAHVRINAFKGDVFDGRVMKVPLARTADRTATATAGYFKVEVEVEPKADTKLLSGLAANVDIEIAAHSGLTLPSQAILERPTDELPESIRESNPLVDRSRRTTPIVFRIIDGKATVTPVKTGPSNLTDTLVAAGLQEGDAVVVGPYKVLEKLKDGEAVEPEKPAKTPDSESKTPAAVASTSPTSGS